MTDIVLYEDVVIDFLTGDENKGRFLDRVFSRGKKRGARFWLVASAIPRLYSALESREGTPGDPVMHLDKFLDQVNILSILGSDLKGISVASDSRKELFLHTVENLGKDAVVLSNDKYLKERSPQVFTPEEYVSKLDGELVSRPLPFADLNSQQMCIREKLEKNIFQVLKHGRYIMGPEVGELEEKLASYVGVKHAIGCASGTDALLLALMAYGIGPGDAIFTTPFTFIATAEVISLLGAIPVFVDIDPCTFNIDPEQLKLAVKALRSNDSARYPLPRHIKVPLAPRGIITVDLFGLPANYNRIHEIAEREKLFVIEDAAQSFGAKYKGKKACGLGDIGCTSFFPAKPLGCYGDGGMCFTDNDVIAEKIRSLRLHGKGGHKYENVRIGINGRLDTLQAAILLAKFEIFPRELEQRQIVASRYNEMLGSLEGIKTPYIPPDYKSAWAQYSVLASSEDQRKRSQGKLKDAGIPTAIYYPKPLHLQKAFSYLGYESGDFPASEDCARKIFSIPMHPYMTESEQVRIKDALS